MYYKKELQVQWSDSSMSNWAELRNCRPQPRLDGGGGGSLRVEYAELFFDGV